MKNQLSKRKLALKMYSSALSRARKKNIPFSLSFSHVLQLLNTEQCPALGVHMEPGGDWRTSPTLDRIIPELGYTDTNTIVVSGLANAIKNCATPSQMMMVATFYCKLEERMQNPNAFTC